jgi:hypothetical protein
MNSRIKNAKVSEVHKDLGIAGIVKFTGRSCTEIDDQGCTDMLVIFLNNNNGDTYRRWDPGSNESL